MMITPVILFVYKRLDTTLCVLEALQSQSQKPPLLIVFSDGPRSAEDAAQVRAVRTAIRAITWTDVKLVARASNQGGAANLIEGLSEVFAHFDQAVILEDDTLPAPCFYEAMLLLLDHYRDTANIFSVGGYPSLLRGALPAYPYDVILSPRFNIWGWGTWQDRWQQAQPALYEFENPFNSSLEVPTHAGSDLPEIARQAESNNTPYFWLGSSLALLALYHGWRHALTKDYLIINIGQNAGQNARDYSTPRLRSFFKKHNILRNKLPAQLPDSTDTTVDQAVKTYIDQVFQAMNRDRQAAMPMWRRVQNGVCAIFKRLTR